MDPETAKKLFESGANVILLNVPPGTEIGIDMQSWRTGPEFKGIKMIPSGLHFIYFRFVHVFTEKKLNIKLIRQIYRRLSQNCGFYVNSLFFKIPGAKHKFLIQMEISQKFLAFSENI